MSSRRLVVCLDHVAARSAYSDRPPGLVAWRHPPMDWTHADGSVTVFAWLDCLGSLRGQRFETVEWRADPTPEQAEWARANLLAFYGAPPEPPRVLH